MKFLCTIFILLFFQSLSIQAQVDIYIVDDFYSRISANGYYWQSMELYKDQQLICRAKDHLTWICSVQEDTLWGNGEDLKEGVNADFLDAAIFFTDFQGTCMQGLGFTLGGLSLQSTYQLNFYTNWGDTAKFTIDHTRNSYLFDLRYFYDGYDIRKLKHNLEQGDTLYIHKRISRCASGDIEELKLYKKQENYVCEIDQKIYPISTAMFNEIINFRHAIWDLEKTSTDVEPDLFTTCTYIFKQGMFLLAEEDITGGDWPLFDQLKTKIKEQKN